MATCHISISRVSPGLYELRVKTPGSLGRGRRLTRALPPDFSDFIAQAPPDRPNRKWRRPPTGSENEDVLFWAGNLETLKEIGGRLYESLFLADPAEAQEDGEDFTTALLTARGMAADKSGVGVEIDLSEAPELSRIPWEALYLAPQDLLLGIDSRTNVVRRLEFNSPLPQPIQPPIRMLVAVANPDSALEAGTEIGDIERRLVNLLREDETSYEIAKLPHATRIALQDRIETWKPHIIHFIGHGGFDEQGLIYLHSETNPGARDAIDSATLRDLVSESPPWLVVLNSCLSGAAAKADPFAGAAQNLIRANVPFVVAMQTSISDDAAIRFSRRFYAALASGEPVATAVTRGRNGIRTLEDESLQAELITPVLYTSGKAEQIAVAAPLPPPPKPEPRPSIWVKVERGLLILAAIAAIAGVPIAIYSVLDHGPPANSARSVSNDLSAPPSDTVVMNNRSQSRRYRGGPVSAQGQYLPPDRYDYTADTQALEDESYASNAAYAAVEEIQPPVQSAPPPQRSSSSRARAPTTLRASPPPARFPPVPPRTMADPDRRQATGADPAPPWAAALARRRLEIARGRSRFTVGAMIDEEGSIAFSSVMQAMPSLSLPGPDDYETIIDEDTVAATESTQRALLLPSDKYLGAAIVATFASGSAVPGRIDIERPAAVLSSPIGGAMAIELVGSIDPREALTRESGLGLARAENVAGALRDRAIPAARIVTASAGTRWSRHSSWRLDWKRDVEARLVLRDADRIAFAFDGAEIAPDDALRLDRIARFARENPGFDIGIEGHAEAGEANPFDLSRRRVDSVRAQLRERGVEGGRLRIHPYGESHPELIGAAGPGADRRVQLVLLPPYGPDPAAPSAPPPAPPTRP
jgi:outer membrane protein OmpA-like peptidoglycan-associated protein